MKRRDQPLSVRTRHGTVVVRAGGGAEGGADVASVFRGDARLDSAPFHGRFFAACAAHLTDRFAHLALEVAGPCGRVLGVQPGFLTTQDALAGAPAWAHAALGPLRAVWPGCVLQRMLMVGSCAGEGVLAGESEADRAQLAAAIAAAAPGLARGLGASLIVVKDVPGEMRPALESPLRGAGFARVPSLPACTLDLSGLATFDDYLVTLSKSRRSDLRRKFKKADAAGLSFRVLADPGPHLGDLARLYHNVYERSSLRFEHLSEGFFGQLARDCPDRARFFCWFLEGRPVAFNLGWLHGGTLRDLVIGLDYAVALDLHLYFATWRDVIAWCLAGGVRRYWTAPLNYDPKLALHLRLVPLDLYARHRSGILNPLVRRLLPLVGPTRSEPLLSRFANFADLS